MAHPLHSLSAPLDTPDAIVRAGRMNLEAGPRSRALTSTTPYPVHGMDRAMRLGPSRMGFFALAFGLLGAISSVAIR